MEASQENQPEEQKGGPGYVRPEFFSNNPMGTLGADQLEMLKGARRGPQAQPKVTEEHKNLLLAQLGATNEGGQDIGWAISKLQQHFQGKPAPARPAPLLHSIYDEESSSSKDSGSSDREEDHEHDEITEQRIRSPPPEKTSTKPVKHVTYAVDKEKQVEKRKSARRSAKRPPSKRRSQPQREEEEEQPQAVPYSYDADQDTGQPLDYEDGDEGDGNNIPDDQPEVEEVELTPEEYYRQMIRKYKRRGQFIRFSELRKVKELTPGAFGQVFVASWRGSKVVVKKLIEVADFDNAGQRDHILQLKRFKREAKTHRIAAHHPNIAAFLGVSVDDNDPSFHLYTLTEYYPAGNLQECVRKQRLSWPDKILLAKSAAAGLLHLAKLRFLHRDIAARNMLIDRDGKSVRVVDFGLAKSSSDARNLASLAGDPSWTAPETLITTDGKPKHNEFTDVYSFGVMLWEIGTNGDEPYARELALMGKKYPSELMWEMRTNDLRPHVDDSWDLFFRILMAWCWHRNNRQRPGFQVVWNILSEYHKLLSCDGGEEAIHAMAPEEVIEKMLSWCSIHCKSNDEFEGEEVGLTFWQTKGLFEQYLIQGKKGRRTENEREKGKEKEGGAKEVQEPEQKAQVYVNADTIMSMLSSKPAVTEEEKEKEQEKEISSPTPAAVVGGGGGGQPGESDERRRMRERLEARKKQQAGQNN